MSEVKKKDPETPAEWFVYNLVELCGKLQSIVTKAISAKVKTNANPKLLDMVSGLISAQNPDDSVCKFISASATYWDRIIDKDMSLITKNAAVLFAEIPPFLVQPYADLFSMKTPKGEAAVEEKDLKEFWDTIHTMLGLAVFYVHVGRKPIFKTVGGEVTITYSIEFFPTAKVKVTAEKLNVNLTKDTL